MVEICPRCGDTHGRHFLGCGNAQETNMAIGFTGPSGPLPSNLYVEEAKKLKPLAEEQARWTEQDLHFEALFTEYRRFVLVGADKKADSVFFSTGDHHKALGAVGLAGEAAEVLHHCRFADPENWRSKLVKEMGDVLWYFVLKAHAENITIDEIVVHDIVAMDPVQSYVTRVNFEPFETIFGEYKLYVEEEAGSEDAETHLSIKAGEVLDLWKKEFFHTKTPDNYYEKVRAKLGEVLRAWVAVAIQHELTIDEIVTENMRKLVLRYPERHPDLVAKFTDAA